MKIKLPRMRVDYVGWRRKEKHGHHSRLTISEKRWLMHTQEDKPSLYEGFAPYKGNIQTLASL